MSQTLDPRLAVLYGRRSIRDYVPKPVGDEMVTLLLSAARVAPSACSKNPWYLAVVRQKAMLDAISTSGTSRCALECDKQAGEFRHGWSVRHGWSAVSVARLVCHRNAQGRNARAVARRCVAREDLACDAGTAPLAPCRSDSSDHLPDSSIDCRTSTLAAPRNRQARLWRHRRRAGSRRSRRWEYIPEWQRAPRSS